MAAAGLWLLPILKGAVRACRLSAARKLVSSLRVSHSGRWQGGPRTPAGPAEVEQHTSKARRAPCVQSAEAPASTGKAQALCSLARASAGSWSRRRAEGPAVLLALDLRTTILRCGIRSKGRLHTAQGTHTPPVAGETASDGAQGRCLDQPGPGCSGGQVPQ